MTLIPTRVRVCILRIYRQAVDIDRGTDRRICRLGELRLGVELSPLLTPV